MLDKVAESIVGVVLFVFRFLWWTFRWTVATAILLAIMGFTALYILDRAMAGGEMVEVPDIQGLPITEASQVLAQRDLEIGQQRERMSEEVPRFHVISQRPQPGQVVRTGRSVTPTVSGPEHVTAPDVVGKSLSEAREQFNQSRFDIGTVSRLAADEPRDTILAQEPGAGSRTEHTENINVLVSAGTEGERFLMPEIVGEPVEDAVETLRGLGIEAQANRVERTDAPYDEVLDQYPPPGTTLREDDTVVYDVRDSGEVALAGPRHTVELSYTIPQEAGRRAVTVELIDRRGSRRTAFPRPQDMQDGEPPRYDPGTRIRLPISFHDEMTVEVYLDGEKVRSYYYQGDSEPVITDYETLLGGSG
ncbi:MAG: PASTA domain-containing protein [Candidatus Hydrogenedentota bacterium]